MNKLPILLWIFAAIGALAVLIGILAFVVIQNNLGGESRHANPSTLAQVQQACQDDRQQFVSSYITPAYGSDGLCTPCTTTPSYLVDVNGNPTGDATVSFFCGRWWR